MVGEKSYMDTVTDTVKSATNTATDTASSVAKTVTDGATSVADSLTGNDKKLTNTSGFSSDSKKLAKDAENMKDKALKDLDKKF
ncbi:hypothetical protein K402DRAFT_462058 [Aulographum hederae CBS 113979]|uniref:Uncharacterized protein n=1 Tax=Aulographum hederae CBS 113979 TaxID=1176131 RepID=A0A6G1H4J7_9PEZI|nr:hypothetical protein K402DRAFT_462058 [Aulographum hederae CBS 113979]